MLHSDCWIAHSAIVSLYLTHTIATLLRLNECCLLFDLTTCLLSEAKYSVASVGALELTIPVPLRF